MKVIFKDSKESTRWVAQQNEKNFCFDAAIKLYKNIGDFESQQRCEKAKAVFQPKK